MRHVRLSASDPRVDRRFEFVEVLEREGDLQAAQEVLCAAVDAWQQALRLDPDDTLGAGIILEVAGTRAMQAQMPAAFVEALFDQYAERFDRSLVEPLGYRVPQRLGALVSEVSQARFAQALAVARGCRGLRFGRFVIIYLGLIYHLRCCAKHKSAVFMMS